MTGGLLARFLVSAAAVFAVAAFWALPAEATVYTPTRTDDPVPNGCAATDCSLREAVIASESSGSPGADVIVLYFPVYKLEQPVDNPLTSQVETDTPQTGDLDIEQAASSGVNPGGTLKILGAGAWTTAIDANWKDRAIDIVAGADVYINKITVRNGYARPDGHATNHGHGGGIHNHGTLTLEESTIGYSSPLDLSLKPNVFGLWGGGGLTNAGGAKATLRNVTVTNNVIWGGTINGSRTGFGAGIENGGTLDLVNVTVANNSVIGYPLGTPIPAGHGGGIAKVGGTAMLKNTIVAENDSGNCVSPTGTIGTAGNNLDSDGTCGLNGSGDLRPPSGQFFLDPKFGTSFRDADNYIWLHPLLGTSPAVDAGTNTGCPSVDEGGTNRPQGASCDIGAFELVPPTRISNIRLAFAKYPLKLWLGQELPYTLVVANEGSAAAKDVVLEALLPEGAELLSTSEGCEGETTVTCKLGALEEGARIEVTIVVRPTVPGLARTEAVVSSATPDHDEADNRAVAETEVTG